MVQARDGRVLSANAAAERMLGMSEAELRAESQGISDWRFVDEHGQPLTPTTLPPNRALSERRD
ncbi:MAG: PAS domain-containing protein [Rhodanobacteraceae bacterium]|nr:PAS domain-containing protein [Rhodanobacteraceae bacterium]